MALFVLRYISNLMIFALGLRAPGIIGNTEPDYSSVNDEMHPGLNFYHDVSKTSIKQL